MLKILFCTGRIKDYNLLLKIEFENLPPTSKNQIIVSKPHYLGRLIITDINQRNLHTGREPTLCLICNFCWIPSCRGL